MLRTKHIYLELFIGYVPLIALWLVGIFGLPYGFSLAYSGEAIGYIIFGSVALGAIGVWGAMQLSRKIIWPDTDFPISKYRNHLICGCVACILASVFFLGTDNTIAVYLLISILITAHLYHVSATNS